MQKKRNISIGLLVVGIIAMALGILLVLTDVLTPKTQAGYALFFPGILMVLFGVTGLKVIYDTPI